jgi:hypothetical protein
MSLDSQYIDPVLVQDSNVATDSKIFFPIVSGGNQTYQIFTANSGSSTSSINYNFTLPSDSCFVDRQLMHLCTISQTFTIGPGVPVGVSCFNLGTTDAFQSFPFNSLINTFSATINGMQLKNNLGQYKDIRAS